MVLKSESSQGLGTEYPGIVVVPLRFEMPFTGWELCLLSRSQVVSDSAAGVTTDHQGLGEDSSLLVKESKQTNDCLHPLGYLTSVCFSKQVVLRDMKGMMFVEGNPHTIIPSYKALILENKML